MLSEPTFGLPLRLLHRLERTADRGWASRPSVAELRADAELALELAERRRDTPQVVADLLDASLLSDVWLTELPMALAWGGLVDEAVEVGDAITGSTRRSRRCSPTMSP
jgi:hypothetical protein